MAADHDLTRRRLRTENAWSQIDVQLERRHDLIPNLGETVKGYAGHERQTLESVIKARPQAIDASGVASRAAAEILRTGALRRLFAFFESGPDLKANPNFLRLQEELASTEHKIGYARPFYKDTVSHYNTAIQCVPTNLVASAVGFRQREFFEAAAERQAPVEF